MTKNDDFDITNASASQLREALAKYGRQQHPQVPAAPVAPGVTAEMTPAKQDEVSANYAQALLLRPTNSLTDTEKEYIRSGARAALRELGY
jgi:hypothetical protein